MKIDLCQADNSGFLGVNHPCGEDDGKGIAIGIFLIHNGVTRDNMDKLCKIHSEEAQQLDD